MATATLRTPSITTRFASTTIHHATITRRVGTTSTSSDGWMQIKINFLCRDSILAAPLLLDLTLLSDLAARAGRYGTQRFLSFFLKAPMHDYTKGEEAVNNLYQQYTMLKNAIREMGGYEADEEID